EGNAFIYTPTGISAQQGSPSILCNDVHDDSVVNAILVKFTTNATIACNTISSCQGAIVSVNAIGTLIANNSIDECATGIDVTLTKDAVVVNNTVRFSTGVQLNLWHASGVVQGNVLLDGRADAAVVDHSPLLFANNTIGDNAQAGLRLRDTSTDVEGNLVTRNAVGIALEGGSVPHLRANVLANNTVGLDVPYASRQAVPWMEGNLVNGVNVDGALDPSQQVYFYKAANVSVSGGVRDSGFSAGYFGSLTAQGNVVLYEVDTATVQGALLAHARAGVLAVNSFNVVVQGATILQTQVGVGAMAVPAPSEVPPCVVSVKASNVTIPVDPAGTVGIDAQGCRVQVLRTNVSLVDTGIRADASSPLLVVNASVTDARVGLDVAARDLNVTGSLVARNGVGLLARGSVGSLVEDRIEDNAGPGLVLASGADLRLLGNALTGNGAGVVDVQPCGGPATCGKVEAEGNLVADNRGDGASINGTTTWRGDRFLANRGTGARLGSATLVDVVASGNDRDGVEARGAFTLRGSSFDHNGRHGAYLVGSGDLADSSFTSNAGAGIRASPTSITALGLNVSDNLDGILFDDASASPVAPSVPATPPPVSVQGVWGLLGGAGLAGASVMDVHRSLFVGNERDAIRAGSAFVNATSNYWGSPMGPPVDVADQAGAYQNGVSPGVRFLPYYTDPGMTTTGPVGLL